ncbi:pyridoxamine 5'-phosphate oxidase family protein [Streptomyces sp. WM6386]|uniref:pyridoxamine 5'-phosphate oxidase family protein n=1 Tax=Streptomyces sp. WM6386 TaxID=1415558 RepID=UPI000619F8EA|nr:pyridoxamine 5'-phosphate oxidase family protein [Streptomyces sp. WM6386]KKD06577.1 pyridoxamine 5-phosphate oxidase [Streptomyces sp. WM6386]
MGVYHAGSRAVQDRVGVRGTADHVGRAIGEGIKPVAAAFLEMQPFLVAGAGDPATGRVWASVLTGPPGFVRATGPHQMSVTGGVPGTDPLATALATPGTPVGTIALDPRTRRRMRLNGRLRPTERGFAVAAEKVFANCPKYLQRRESYEVVDARSGGAPQRGVELTPDQAEFITSSDTFFLATVHPAGADASHRGGNPGFVTVTSPRELSWRDYPGNAMFLTLGNLATDPRAGLLFLDWTTGTLLQLTGEARTEFDGAERRVCFRLAEALETPSAVPLRWSAPEYSPANPGPAG